MKAHIRNQDAVAAAAKAQPAWEKLPTSGKQAIFMRAVNLLESESWQSRFTKAMKDELAFTDLWVLYNLKGAHHQLMDGVASGPAIRGQTFPSTFAPGGHAIVQRKPHGVM